MIRLFKKIFIFFLFVVTAFLILKFFSVTPKNYNSAFVDKLQMLQNNKYKKKIVLIGGSSVGWGLSAELIEKETGMKTINLGHQAGFGLIDFQSFLYKNINKDDIIIFSPEWEFYQNPDFCDKATLDNLIRYNFGYGRLIGNDIYMLESIFSKIKSERYISNDRNNPYIYNCLNKNGDVISQCDLKSRGPMFYKLQQGLLKISSFPKYFPFLLSNKTIFIFPPTQQKVYNENKQYLKSIEASLYKNNYTLLNNVEDNVYADSDFFDAEYHITCESRIHRTEKLINYLKLFFQQGFL